MKVLVLLTFLILGTWGTEDVNRKFTNSHGGYQFFHAEQQHQQKLFENKHFHKKETFKTTTELDIDNDIAENVNKYDTTEKHATETNNAEEENAKKVHEETNARKRNQVSVKDEETTIDESKRKVHHSRRRIPNRNREKHDDEATSRPNGLVENSSSSARVRRIRFPRRRTGIQNGSEGKQEANSNFQVGPTIDTTRDIDNVENNARKLKEEDNFANLSTKNKEHIIQEDCTNCGIKQTDGKSNGDFKNINHKGYTLPDSKDGTITKNSHNRNHSNVKTPEDNKNELPNNSTKYIEDQKLQQNSHARNKNRNRSNVKTSNDQNREDSKNGLPNNSTDYIEDLKLQQDGTITKKSQVRNKSRNHSNLKISNDQNFEDNKNEKPNNNEDQKLQRSKKTEERHLINTENRNPKPTNVKAVEDLNLEESRNFNNQEIRNIKDENSEELKLEKHQEYVNGENKNSEIAATFTGNRNSKGIIKSDTTEVEERKLDESEDVKLKEGLHFGHEEKGNQKISNDDSDSSNKANTKSKDKNFQDKELKLEQSIKTKGIGRVMSEALPPKQNEDEMNKSVIVETYTEYAQKHRNSNDKAMSKSKVQILQNEKLKLEQSINAKGIGNGMPEALPVKQNEDEMNKSVILKTFTEDSQEHRSSNHKTISKSKDQTLQDEKVNINNEEIGDDMPEALPLRQREDASKKSFTEDANSEDNNKEISKSEEQFLKDSTDDKENNHSKTINNPKSSTEDLKTKTKTKESQDSNSKELDDQILEATINYRTQEPFNRQDVASSIKKNERGNHKHDHVSDEDNKPITITPETRRRNDFNRRNNSTVLKYNRRNQENHQKLFRRKHQRLQTTIKPEVTSKSENQIGSAENRRQRHEDSKIVAAGEEIEESKPITKNSSTGRNDRGSEESKSITQRSSLRRKVEGNEESKIIAQKISASKNEGEIQNSKSIIQNSSVGRKNEESGNARRTDGGNETENSRARGNDRENEESKSISQSTSLRRKDEGNEESKITAHKISAGENEGDMQASKSIIQNSSVRRKNEESGNARRTNEGNETENSSAGGNDRGNEESKFITQNTSLRRKDKGNEESKIIAQKISAGKNEGEIQNSKSIIENSSVSRKNEESGNARRTDGDNGNKNSSAGRNDRRNEENKTISQNTTFGRKDEGSEESKIIAQKISAGKNEGDIQGSKSIIQNSSVGRKNKESSSVRRTDGGNEESKSFTQNSTLRRKNEESSSVRKTAGGNEESKSITQNDSARRREEVNEKNRSVTKNLRGNEANISIIKNSSARRTDLVNEESKSITQNITVRRRVLKNEDNKSINRDSKGAIIEEFKSKNQNGSVRRKAEENENTKSKNRNTSVEKERANSKTISQDESTESAGNKKRANASIDQDNFRGRNGKNPNILRRQFRTRNSNLNSSGEDNEAVIKIINARGKNLGDRQNVTTKKPQAAEIDEERRDFLGSEENTNRRKLKVGETSVGSNGRPFRRKLVRTRPSQIIRNEEEVSLSEDNENKSAHEVKIKTAVAKASVSSTARSFRRKLVRTRPSQIIRSEEEVSPGEDNENKRAHEDEIKTAVDKASVSSTARSFRRKPVTPRPSSKYQTIRNKEVSLDEDNENKSIKATSSTVRRRAQNTSDDDHGISNRRRYAEFVRRSWQNQNQRRGSSRKSGNIENLNSNFDTSGENLRSHNIQVKRSFPDRSSGTANQFEGRKESQDKVEEQSANQNKKYLESSNKETIDSNQENEEEAALEERRGDNIVHLDKLIDSDVKIRTNHQGNEEETRAENTEELVRNNGDQHSLHDVMESSPEGLENFDTVSSSDPRKDQQSSNFEEVSENEPARNVSTENQSNETNTEAEKKMYNPYKILERLSTTQKSSTPDQFNSASEKLYNLTPKHPRTFNFRKRLRTKSPEYFGHGIETTSNKIVDVDIKTPENISGLVFHQEKSEPNVSENPSYQLKTIHHQVKSKPTVSEIKTVSDRPSEINPHHLHLTEKNSENLEPKTTSGRPININPHHLHLPESEETVEPDSNKRPTRTLTVYSRNAYKLNSPSKEFKSNQNKLKIEEEEVTRRPARILTVYTRPTPKRIDDEDIVTVLTRSRSIDDKDILTADRRKLVKPSPTEETKRKHQFSRIENNISSTSGQIEGSEEESVKSENYNIPANISQIEKNEEGKYNISSISRSENLSQIAKGEVESVKSENAIGSSKQLKNSQNGEERLEERNNLPGISSDQSTISNLSENHSLANAIGSSKQLKNSQNGEEGLEERNNLPGISSDQSTISNLSENHSLANAIGISKHFENFQNSRLGGRNSHPGISSDQSTVSNLEKTNLFARRISNGRILTVYSRTTRAPSIEERRKQSELRYEGERRKDQIISKAESEDIGQKIPIGEIIPKIQSEDIGQNIPRNEDIILKTRSEYVDQTKIKGNDQKIPIGEIIPKIESEDIGQNIRRNEDIILKTRSEYVDETKIKGNDQKIPIGEIIPKMESEDIGENIPRNEDIILKTKSEYLDETKIKGNDQILQKSNIEQTKLGGINTHPYWRRYEHRRNLYTQKLQQNDQIYSSSNRRKLYQSRNSENLATINEETKRRIYTPKPLTSNGENLATINEETKRRIYTPKPLTISRPNNEIRRRLYVPKYNRNILKTRNNKNQTHNLQNKETQLSNGSRHILGNNKDQVVQSTNEEMHVRLNQNQSPNGFRQNLGEGNNEDQVGQSTDEEINVRLNQNQSSNGFRQILGIGKNEEEVGQPTNEEIDQKFLKAGSNFRTNENLQRTNNQNPFFNTQNNLNENASPTKNIQNENSNSRLIQNESQLSNVFLLNTNFKDENLEKTTKHVLTNSGGYKEGNIGNYKSILIINGDRVEETTKNILFINTDPSKNNHPQYFWLSQNEDILKKLGVTNKDDQIGVINVQKENIEDNLKAATHLQNTNKDDNLNNLQKNNNDFNLNNLRVINLQNDNNKVNRRVDNFQDTNSEDNVGVSNLQNMNNRNIGVSNLQNMNHQNLGVFNLQNMNNQNKGVPNLQNMHHTNLRVANLQNTKTENIAVSNLRNMNNQNIGVSNLQNMHHTNKRVSNLQNTNTENIAVSNLQNMNDQNIGVPNLQNMNNEDIGVSNLQNMHYTNKRVSNLQNTNTENIAVSNLQNMNDQNIGVPNLQNMNNEDIGVSNLQNMHHANIRVSNLQNTNIKNIAVSNLQNMNDQNTGASNLQNMHQKNIGVSNLQIMNNEDIGVSNHKNTNDENIGKNMNTEENLNVRNLQNIKNEDSSLNLHTVNSGDNLKNLVMRGLFENSIRNQNFILKMRRMGKDNITTTVSPLSSAKLKRELYTRRPLQKRVIVTSSTRVPFYERFFNATRILRQAVAGTTTPRAVKDTLFGQLKSTPRSDLPFLQKFRRHT